MDYVDPVVCCAWVSEQTGVDVTIVETVLEVELEYMVGVGLIEFLDDDGAYEYRYYDPCYLLTRPDGSSPSRLIDNTEIARDAERFTGVPFETALQVLDAEGDFFGMCRSA